VGVRQALADVIEAALTPPVVVYAYPADNPVVPAVLVVPDGADYQRPLTFGRNGIASVVLWSFRIQILEQRSEPSTALDALEARRKEVTDALKDMPGAMWSGLVDVGETMIADIPSLGGSVLVTVKIGDED